jgi:hypothetical protein
MSFFSKFGFIHRRLWDRDGFYRVALLFGPGPLIGAGLAAGIWFMVHAVTAPGADVKGDTRADIPWAHYDQPVSETGQPFAEAPTEVLPLTDASGRFVGFQPGWRGAIHPMTVDATMDVNVQASVLTDFQLEQPAIQLTRLLDAGPPTGLFAAAATTLFVAQTPGLYAFSVRLVRSGTQSADCVVRFRSAKHWMVRNVRLDIAGTAVVTYPPTEFRLEPGLVSLTVAVGCWRGDRMVGGGDLTLMVRHPGETALKPAAADEIVTHDSAAQ